MEAFRQSGDRPQLSQLLPCRDRYVYKFTVGSRRVALNLSHIDLSAVAASGRRL